MSSEGGKTHEVPAPSTSPSVLPNTPPKRFLGSSSHLFSAKRSLSSALSSASSSLSSNLSASASLRLQLQQSSSTPPQPQPTVTPPKLTRFPTVVLTPVDITKLQRKGELIKSPSSSSSTGTSLPPPPPLIKMPISTRKDKRAATPAIPPKIDDAESVEEVEKYLEPPRKRTRTASAMAAAVEKSVEGSRGESTTPRKIIQEIFGPDKSKRSKGKGRKKRRAPTPKKKVLAASPDIVDGRKEEDFEADDDQEEDQDEEGTENKMDLEDAEETQQEEVTLKDVDNEADNLKADDILPPEDEEVKSEGEEEDDEKQDEVEEEGDDAEEEDKNSGCENDEEEGQDETASVASSTRRVSRRHAKVVANERLKRLSQSEEGNRKEEEQEQEGVSNEDGESYSIGKTQAKAGSVQSRRSTTEGSSKSGSSIAQQDSESSGGGEGSVNNKSNELEMDRQRFNPTPFSNVSDYDYDLKEECPDNMSVGDMQEHKDSDVDSTYSWKPVRAAAAAALEQVTKNQGGGSGSTGLPGDAESKAAAAAERRARKVNRYKGRNRRTLTFKSSSSKKYTAVRNNRYSAQPTIAPKVFHHGHYFQPGDIVYVDLADGTPLHGQIRGLMMDHFGETSAGIRFLAPKHPIYAFMDFDPSNYAFRYDVSEKLIKIEFVNFVMHLNLDHFDGHPSYGKIEKNTLYTRMGKSLQKGYGKEEDGSGVDSDSSTDIDNNSGSNSSSSDSENDDKNGKDKEVKDGRRRHISDSSTDVEQDSKEKDEKIHRERIDVIKEEDEEEENGVAQNETNSDTRTKMEVDVN